MGTKKKDKKDLPKVSLTTRGECAAEASKHQKLPQPAEKYLWYFDKFIWNVDKLETVFNAKKEAKI